MSIQQGDIIYFIVTDRFAAYPYNESSSGNQDPFSYHGGNFDGIISRIPYLKKLGVTALWITPVYEQMVNPRISAQPYHGYWAYDFNAVDNQLYADKEKYPSGSKKYLKDLVDKLHDAGIKVILDMVVNHTGYGHPGQYNLPVNKTPIRKDWFNKQGLDSSENIIEGELCGLPDLNLDNIEVIDYHIKTIESWILETGIDCIRMDTAKHVERGFWNYFKTLIRGKYPHVSLIGEVLVFNMDELTDYQKYWGFDSLFDFPVQRAMEEVFIYGNGMTTFYSPFNSGTGLFEKDSNYSNHNRLVSLLDNHDLPARFFTVAINHIKEKERSVAVLKLALTFIFTTRGIPQLYYGNEVGMEGSADPDNRRDFNWEIFDKNYTVKNTFPIEKEIFEHTCKLSKIRSENDALYSGYFVCLYVDYFLMVVLSYSLNSFVITAYHNGNIDMGHQLSVSIFDHPQIPQRIKDLLGVNQLTCLLTGEKISFANGNLSIQLKAKSAMIFSI